MSKERLREVMLIQSETYETKDMEKFIVKRYEEISKGNESEFSILEHDGNIYITKGHADTYPCVVAHTDTVHDIIPYFDVFEDDECMFAMDMQRVLQVGIGGDDKVGIYVALEMLMRHDTIKVAFFRDEEHGCLGSREALMSWFGDVEFVLQCDRQGYKDFVRTIYSTKLFGKKFLKAVRPYLQKYKKKETDDGGLTDVYQLVENGLNVCVANISCGYHRPHSDDEIILLNEVFLTTEFVNEVILNIAGTKWINPHFKKYSPPTYGAGVGSVWDRGLEERDMVKKTYGTVDDFHDGMIDTDTLDLENVCSECDTDEIMYDRAQDADWCFSCDKYTNFYSNSPLKEDDVLTDEDYNNAFIQEDESTI